MYLCVFVLLAQKFPLANVVVSFADRALFGLPVSNVPVADVCQSVAKIHLAHPHFGGECESTNSTSKPCSKSGAQLASSLLTSRFAIVH